MSKILRVNQSCGFAVFSKKVNCQRGKNAIRKCNVLNLGGKTKKRERSFSSGEPNGSAGFVKIGFVFVFFLVIFSGVGYLYQVNDLASKGYEIREIEKEIKELQKNNEKIKIQEIEMKSMYNIEKELKNLDLVGINEISYLDLDGPIAMK